MMWRGWGGIDLEQMVRSSQLTVLVSLAFAAGCVTVVRSEAELFFQNHPELRKHYTRLSPTDAASVREQAELIFRSREWAIGAVTNRVSGEVVAREVADMKRFASAARDERLNAAEELEKLTKSSGGQIYKYEFHNGQKAEWGFLILRSGEIVGKVDVTHGKIYD